MIKRELNELYKELISIQRKLDGGHMKYYGDKPFGNGMSYHVYLKDGRYFTIFLGSKFVPRFKKRDVLYIVKAFSTYREDECNYRTYRTLVQDTEAGRHHGSVVDAINKAVKRYNIDTSLCNEINTEYWD